MFSRYFWEWSDSLVVKSTYYCSCRESRFHSQHSSNNSQLHVTLDPGYRWPLKPPTHRWYTKTPASSRTRVAYAFNSEFRQISEFNVNLVYRGSSRRARGSYTEKPCLKRNKQANKTVYAGTQTDGQIDDRVEAPTPTENV